VTTSMEANRLLRRLLPQKEMEHNHNICGNTRLLSNRPVHTNTNPGCIRGSGGRQPRCVLW
jgi:hypothetical protein